MLAGLLYVGAGIGLAAVSLATRRAWPHLKPSDQWRLAIIALVGGLLGPSLLMIGLMSVSGLVGSLLLNLEAVFTIALAVMFFGDRLKATEWFGGMLVLAGAAILSYHPGAFSAHWLGVLAIVGACLSWGLDNNLTQRISANDPIMIVQIKALAAGSANVLLAFALGQAAVRGHALLPTLLVGFVCYGISIVLDVYALRYLGAAREAVFFTTAPFLGAIAAVPILGEHFDRFQASAAVMMAVGVLAFKFPRRAS
jgi:drug/metabolite transporter (DMT)-like permease